MILEIVRQQLPLQFAQHAILKICDVMSFHHTPSDPLPAEDKIKVAAQLQRLPRKCEY